MITFFIGNTRYNNDACYVGNCKRSQAALVLEQTTSNIKNWLTITHLKLFVITYK